MKKKYETIFITKPDLEDSANSTLHKKISSLISKKGGKVHVLEDKGKLRLAYEIKKNMKGRYHYLGFEGEGTLLKEVERNLKLSESVIKFQSHRIENDFNSTITPMEMGRSSSFSRGKPKGSYDGGRESRGYDRRERDSIDEEGPASIPEAMESIVKE